MSLVGSITGIFNKLTPADVELSKLRETAPTPGVEAGALGTPQPSATRKSFATIFDKMVGEVDGTLKAADAEKAKVLSGESTNLHQAMISMQEASVAFSLMVEVRNKLVESYQEIMRMQV